MIDWFSFLVGLSAIPLLGLLVLVAWSVQQAVLGRREARAAREYALMRCVNCYTTMDRHSVIDTPGDPFNSHTACPKPTGYWEDGADNHRWKQCGEIRDW